MKKLICSIISAIMIINLFAVSAFAKFELKNKAEVTDSYDFETGDEIEGAYLIEASTGKVLYAKNEYKSMIPASVTKIMTLLLVAEALDCGKIRLEETVSVSEHAAGKGGSQVFLKEGERISVLDLLKSTIIASANDAATALAELVSGSESSFVKKMNARAVELGLKNTAFENVTGLDDTTTNHYSCPADIAKMSRELIKHDVILQYSSVWQDSIRGGEFILTNTNRLVRYYDGCNGLKTGSTDKAGFCISATAKRGNMQLIAVVMGAPTRDIRNNAARELLDYGFSNYRLYEDRASTVELATVLGGKKSEVGLNSTGFSTVISKDEESVIVREYIIPENLRAPISKGEIIGKIIYKINGDQIGYSDIYAADSIESIGFYDVFIRIIKKIIVG